MNLSEMENYKNNFKKPEQMDLPLEGIPQDFDWDIEVGECNQQGERDRKYFYFKEGHFYINGIKPENEVSARVFVDTLGPNVSFVYEKYPQFRSYAEKMVEE
jgi:hypothetical protein